ncbi:RING finger protein-like protein, partial [Tothia fuscella]
MDDERLEELSTIEAIFPELSRDPNNTFCASLELPVSPTNGLTVRFPATIDGVSTTLPTDDSDNRPDSPGSSVNEDKHALSHLPPLLLQITLPEGYPENAPPFVQISTSPAWLPPKSVQELEQYAAMMWEEYGHLQVVFSYIDYLQQAAERGFDIATQNGGVLALEQDMKISMLDLDIKTKKKIFDNETFECGVCLEPKKGSVCYRLRKCGHVFCVDCLKGVYNNAIQEGNIAQMICLEFGCGQEKAPGEQRAKKPARTLTPQELLQIPLERNMVQRYVDLKRKKRLESDPNTIYCPRKWCQGPAKTKKYPKRTLTDLREEEEASESEAEEEAPAPKVPTDLSTKQDTIDISQDRVRICEDCNYAFCRVCHLGWHGEFIRCWPRSNAERTEEEQASYDYIRMHTSPCPSCTVPCQKTQGCNHMNCYQCNTHFCYLCSSWLDPQNPYQHFNEEGRDCFQRLWELEEGDNGQGNVQFVGVRGAENAAIE